MVKIIDNTNLGYLISKIKAAFWPKTDVIQIGLDNTPISGSDNLVKSGGVYTALNSKQDTLVSGTNIKTINNESLLGSGNISIAGDTGSGEANVIEAITFNGTPATITNKTAAITATIPAEVTESTVSNWGFTKNTGTYSKPSGGIPATDLASAVQTSLGKADTALQSFTETDPTVPSWAKQSTKPTYTASEVGALPSTTVIPTKVSDLTNDSGFTSNTGTITGITMNGTSKGTSGVVDLGTVLTSETSLSKGTTTGSGNAVTDISVSGHQITLTKGSTFLTSETSLSKGTTTGSGNAVTDISVSGHEITLTKSSTFLTSHQSIKTINSQTITGTGNITINELPSVTSSDNGKMLQVINGVWTLVSVATILSGSGTPSNSTGNNGDIYLQTS